MHHCSVKRDVLSIEYKSKYQVAASRAMAAGPHTVLAPLQADQQRDDYGHAIAKSSDGSVVVVVGAMEGSQGGTGVMQLIQV